MIVLEARCLKNSGFFLPCGWTDRRRYLQAKLSRLGKGFESNQEPGDRPLSLCGNAQKAQFSVQHDSIVGQK
jgi:hypothetical protein